MLRPQCSYWITIKPRNGLSKAKNRAVMTIAEKIVSESTLMDDMTAERDGDEILLSVTDGSMEQTDDIAEATKLLSRTLPDCIIEYRENNEEPYSPDIKRIFASGHLMSEQFGRRIPPDSVDNTTISVCIDAIRNCTSVEQAVQTLISLKT